ncbi:MAG: hypothetical protein ACNA8W_06145, partial [Bradymonadaceae bacterium]
MSSKQRLLAILVGLATSSAMLMGCGGGADCGDGTVERDGECVLTGSVGACGEGTMLLNGSCVPDSSECPAGTVYSESDNACVASGDSCGEGTTFDTNLKRCLPDISIVCGEGTTLVDGNCVADGTTGPECATGTVLDNGRCVVSPTICSAGTVLDPTTNTCVLSDDACATGLELADGTCIATDELCGDGTHFSADTGLCLPEATCREGDVILDELCVPPAEALAADPGAVSIDGEGPHELTIPAVGEMVIFTGTLDDADDNGNAVSDFDEFTFQGTAGQWVKISVQSLGAPSPAFTVEGPEGFERWSTLGIENNPARLLLLPYEGEYTVTVQSGYQL